MADLHFDITALDKAAGTFIRLAAQVERLSKQLDKLDGKKVAAEVEVKTDKAEREIGAFATNLRKRLEAATKALPEIQIGADGTKAEQALAKVRADMKTLGDKKIGVDISAEKALAEVARIKGELASIAKDKSATVDVKADVASALAALKTVGAEVKHLDGQKATVKVATDKSFADSLIQVNMLGRALRAIALPAAALAVTPQIASLGAAAVSATGALGLLPAALGAVGLAAAVSAVSFGNLIEYFTAASPKKQREAYARLSDSGKHLADTLKALTPQFEALRRATQDAVFKGMADQVKPLAAAYLPALQTQMVGVGRVFNVAALSVAKFFQQKNVSSDMTASLMSMRLAVTNVVLAARPLAQVFVDVFATGAARLPIITKGIAAAAAHFAGFISAARQSGQLGQWMDQGIKTVKELGQTVGNVGSILMSVFHAATVAGGSFTQTLAEVTGQIAAVLKSAKGQEALVAFFTGIRSVVAGLGPVVVALVPTVVALAHSLQSVLGAAVAAVVPVVQALAPLFTALATAAGPVLTTVINALAGPLRNIATAISGALLPVLPPVGDALSQIALAIAPMITQLDALAPAFSAVAQAGAALLQFLGPFLTGMSSTFGTALSTIVPLIVAVADGLTALLHVLTPIAPLLGFAAAALVSFKLAASGVSMVQGVLTGVAKSITDAALQAEVFSEKFTGSTAAAERLSGVGTRLASGLGMVGTALPLVGLAAVGVSLAYDVLRNKSDELAAAVIQGQTTMAAAVDQQTQHIEQQRGSMKALADQGGVSASMLNDLKVGTDKQTASLSANAQAQADLTAKIDAQLAKLPVLEQLQARVKMAQDSYNDAVIKFTANSPQAQSAHDALTTAKERLRQSSQDAADAEKTLGDQIVTTSQQAAAAANADIALQQATLNIADAEQRASEATAQHGASSTQAKEAHLGLMQAYLSAADAARRKAEADATATGATNAAEIGAQAYKDQLLQLAGQASGPTRDALLALANGTTTAGQAAATAEIQARLQKDELGRLGAQASGPLAAAMAIARQNFDTLGGAHATAMQRAQAQKDELLRLANMASGPVRDALTQMANQIRTLPDKQITITGTGVVGGIRSTSGSTAPGAGHAAGGVLPGYTPGRDVHTFRSATGGTLHLSGGEAVMRPEWTRAVGPDYVHSANAAARAGGVGGVRRYMSSGRFADGGILDSRYASGGVVLNGVPLPAVPAQAYAGVQDALIQRLVAVIAPQVRAAEAALAAAAFGGGGGGSITAGGGRAFIIAHESGGNPTAQNPTSTASGLYQMINGTWRAYGGSTPTAKQASVAEQNAVADRYVAARYGSWDNAANFWRAHHWYDQGGYLMPGTTMAVNNTGKPERVLNPAQTRVHDQVTAAVAGGRAQGGFGDGLLTEVRALRGEVHALRGDVDHHGDQAGINARLDVTNRLLAAAGRGSVAGAAEGNRTAGELGPW